MKWTFAIAALAVFSTPADAQRRALLHDPETLNIGINCSWQTRCMAMQRRAMKSALSYVEKHRPPHWKVQLCNRNASRGRVSMDWVGYDHCIHNNTLRPPRTRQVSKHR
jgi:hypothetical protein